MGNLDDNFEPLPSAQDIAEASGKASHALSSVEGTDWHSEFCDLVDPFIAARCVLEEFRDSAPNGRARDWLQGIIDYRLRLASSQDDGQTEWLPSARDIAVPSVKASHALSSVAGTDWHRGFVDRVDWFIAARNILEEFRDSAPNGRARDWLQGIIDTRLMMAFVTGIKF